MLLMGYVLLFFTIVLSLIFIPITLESTFAVEYSKEYQEGYNQGYEKKSPLKANNDEYMKGWDDGLTDVLDGKDKKKFKPEDDDPNEKAGGKDPVVFGEWYYDENDGEECYSKHKFDYDNDGFKENFCYVINGSVFVVDFGGGINAGYNLLNFDGTVYKSYSPIQYLMMFPDTCVKNMCYLWNDFNDDLIAQYDELTLFTFEIKNFTHHNSGIKHSNDRYIYCSGVTTDNDYFYCLQPTYWKKGII